MILAADAPRAIAELGGALRSCGARVGVRDEIDAARALPLVDRGDEDEVRLALRIALKVPRGHWSLFDRVFAVIWRGDAVAREAPPPRPPRPFPNRAPSPPARRLLAWDPVGRRMADAVVVSNVGDGPGGAGASGSRPAWSPTALLRRKSFDSAWSPAELAAMERLLARLARRLATRRSRRYVSSAAAAGGRVDPRRSYRRALATEGEILRLARRERAVRESRLVFLCDTSGSMEAHTRFLLSFVLSLRRVAPKAELFAFNTELAHLTPALVAGKPQVALDRLAALVPDWSGGTRMGASLAAFVAEHLAPAVDGGTVVVILSDGLDRGDPALVAEAMAHIHRRARKVIWLNPLLGDPDYQPTARGMQAALPFIDRFLPAFSIESLETALPQILA